MTEHSELGRHDVGVEDGAFPPLRKRKFGVLCIPTKRAIAIKCYAKGRPAPAHASLRFSEWLAAKIGESRPQWRFSPKALPPNHRAHRDIFAMQARAELIVAGEDGIGAEHFQDLQAVVRNQLPEFFQRADAQPVPQAVFYTSMDLDMNHRAEYNAAELLSSSLIVRRERPIARGRSSALEAAKEVLPKLLGVVDGREYLVQQCFVSAAAHRANNLDNVWEGIDGVRTTMEETTRDISRWAPLGTQAEVLKSGATPFFGRDGLGSLSQGSRQLQDDCENLQGQLDNLDEYMSAVNTPTSTLSVGGALEILERLAGLTNSQLEMKTTLDTIVPLHDKEYTTEKAIGHGAVAATAAIVLVAVAAPWAAAALGSTWTWWGASWLLGHSAVSVVTGVSAGATTVVCGTMSRINVTQRALIDQVCALQLVVRCARDQILAVLTLFLVHMEGFDPEDLEAKDSLKTAFCQALGLQPDLLSQPEYDKAAVITRWNVLSQATKEYLEKCRELAKALE
ncbi:hypothetical protein ACCO45_007806 [Purpureocillium lilacinum]|uniref:Uncharacterized protein n=1 Tax=Purpureocillium lilacinum TaxID=33203 RepID=A0ACC4DMK8_PURLI